MCAPEYPRLKLRGKEFGRSDAMLGRRSIPARAGEWPQVQERRLVTLVYPRACGGMSIPVTRAFPFFGLSPRVRGNGLFLGLLSSQIRSIPARAGEWAPLWSRTRSASVYPRACGGMRRLSQGVRKGIGLSPRSRGNGNTGKLIALPAPGQPSMRRNIENVAGATNSSRSSAPAGKV